LKFGARQNLISRIKFALEISQVRLQTSDFRSRVAKFLAPLVFLAPYFAVKVIRHVL
jgi:hypothetical protein